MKYILAFLLSTFFASFTAQEVIVEYPYNPDYENNGNVIGVEDIIQLLTTFGMEFEVDEIVIDTISLSDWLFMMSQTLIEQQILIDSLSSSEPVIDLSEVDSTISDLEVIIENQQDQIEVLEATAFNGDYNNLTNAPLLLSQFVNDVGFTNFDGDYNNLNNTPELAVVATTGSYNDLSDKLTQKDIVEFAYSLAYADLSGANLHEAHFERAQFWSANLSDADLSSAELNQVNLTYANLSWSNLSNANLYGASCFGADFSNAFLMDVDFRLANLNSANLSNADLSNADMSTTNLSNVIWSGAFIEGCNGCNCEDADNDNYCD
jgi:uncharacterized protein YjbI with pentapeptide repeats